MDIKTKAMGTVSIDGKPRLQMTTGLFGFEQITDYVVLESEYKPFLWLQSVKESGLAFLLVDPFIFFSDYEIDVDDVALEEIEVKDPSDVVVMVIVTVPSSGGSVTANLQGPVIINKKNSKAKQVILNDNRWQTKHDILSTVKKGGHTC
jgi:flagellar assembly factor FliW